MQQMPYSATASSSAKPARPSMCPPHHPHRPHRLTLCPPSRRTSPSLSGIPWWLTQHMVLNLVIATSVSLVSLVGDVPLAAFRLNSRKAVLLKEYVPGHGLPNCTGCYRPRECTATCLTTPRGERRKGPASLKKQPWRSIGWAQPNESMNRRQRHLPTVISATNNQRAWWPGRRTLSLHFLPFPPTVETALACLHHQGNALFSRSHEPHTSRN